MNAYQARTFIEQVLGAPNMMMAQAYVDSNLRFLDTTFFQVLQTMIQEAESQGQFGSSLFSPNMPGIVADYVIDRQSQSDQRVQGLRMLYQYAASRQQQPAPQSSAGGPPTQLLVTCRGCGIQQPVVCPGFNLHLPAATVVTTSQGGACNLCGAGFTYVTCACGTVTNLIPQPIPPSPPSPTAPTSNASHQTTPEADVAPWAAEDAAESESESDWDSAETADESVDASSSSSEGANSMQELFGILQNEFAKEKSKGNMDEARQSGLGSLMERLGELVQGDTPDRSLEDMTRDRGKLDALMTEMMSRIKKPTFEGPDLPGNSRAAKVLELLQGLKAFVGAEGMKQHKADGESTSAMDLFQRMARLTGSIHQTQGDNQKLIGLETDQARALVNEIRQFARRHYITLAQPVWSRGIVPLDPNLIFFAGPDEIREILEYSVTERGLGVNRPARLGADLAESRWQDLRAASLAIFDISDLSPQIFYELGIALTLGTELLIVAREETEVPFDVAQKVCFYSTLDNLRDFLSSELEASLYGLQCAGSDGSSLAATVAYAERLAQETGDSGLTHIALESLRKVAGDPIAVDPAIKLLNTFLKKQAQVIIYPRWPGVYPEPDELRCFIIMPFHKKLDAIYRTIEGVCGTDIKAVRGDVSDGQQIIESIWEDIGRATHITVDLTGFNPNVCLELGIADTLGRNTILIAREGTDKRLKTAFPSIAERRCHTYPDDPASKSAFTKGLTKFLKKP